MSYPFVPKINTITFNEIIKQTHNLFENLPDSRKGAPQTKYSIKDAALSAFEAQVFALQKLVPRNQYFSCNAHPFYPIKEICKKKKEQTMQKVYF